ncbi:hypothetical protein IFM89_002931 [Coptis chinensis]|uniref:BED-type domain-containing protein n=1 Tax=Coptis chinensis TaxID=261450 RepID=A0A835IJI5_9MAGN|nr:hypothetical protein IFM89_002931 [Coptis chinensis]
MSTPSSFVQSVEEKSCRLAGFILSYIVKAAWPRQEPLGGVASRVARNFSLDSPDMPRVRDPLWEYVELTAQKKNKCRFCQVEISGGISRLKYHWAKMIGHDVSPCTAVTDEVMELALNAVTEIEDRPRVNKKARGSNSKEGNTSSSFNFGSQQSVYRASGQSSTVSHQPKVLELLKKKEKEVADSMGVKFLVANNLAFNILRSHELRQWCLAIGKYDNRDLKKPGATRFASQFLCLQSVLKEKEPLRFLVSSNDWQAHKRTKEDDAKALVEVIQSDAFWIKGNEVVAIVEPIVKLLRMVDGDECTLGYIYEGVIRVKESIKAILNNDKDKYDPYLAIIERKRIQRLHSPIHAVAAYLNPKFYYEKIVKMDSEIRDGMSKVRQKLLTSEERKTFTGEINFYHARHSKIFTPMAVDALSNTHPHEVIAFPDDPTPVVGNDVENIVDGSDISDDEEDVDVEDGGNGGNEAPVEADTNNENADDEEFHRLMNRI